MESEVVQDNGQHNSLAMDSLPLPNYHGAGISNVVPAIFSHLARSRGALFEKSYDEILDVTHNVNPGITVDLDSWFPKAGAEATQIVLLVLDGLGFSQLTSNIDQLPHLSLLSQCRISSVAPTTTATALTSITTGSAPSVHGILGYRMRFGRDKVMNTLSWACPTDRSQMVPDPQELQQVAPFLNFHPKVVTKAQYQGSGFTRAHLRETDLVDYRFPSTMISHVLNLINHDEPFVYAYYEGIDTVAHEYGLRENYLEELKAVDYLVGRLISSLPHGCALLITSDHGQVEVPGEPIKLDQKILALTDVLSGEGRFRWLHVKDLMSNRVVELAKELYDSVAWVATREQLVEGGYYGSSVENLKEKARLGDVALIARSNVAFFDPNDTGPYHLVCRHGSLTHDELDVPLLGYLA